MQNKEFILNKKGLKLATVVHKPDSNGTFPAVILLHGFSGDKEEEHIKQLAVDLAKSGFVAIRFDASGYAQSEGTTEKDYRLTNYFSDTEFVYEYLKSLAYVDKDRIGIFGHSVGAMLVILFGTNHPELKALVSVSPPYHLETHYRLRGIWKGWKEKGYLEKESNGKTVKIPYAYLEDANRYNALDEVAKIKSPILFILGTKDINVVPEETKKLYKKANEPKKLFIVDGMDHYYKKYPELLSRVNKNILAFFKENL